MNTWQIHVAARKRVKARKDIFSLLKNGHPRQPKNKKKYSVGRKRFGIFGNAISFKISRNDVHEIRDELSSHSKNSGKTVAVEQIKRTKQTKRTKHLPAENYGYGVTETPKENQDVTNIRNINNNLIQQVQHPCKLNGKHATVSPKQTTCLNVFNNEHTDASPNHQKTIHRSHDVIDEGQLPSHLNTFTDITFDNIQQTTEVQHQMLTFDSLIDANSPFVPEQSIGSIDFNKIEKQIEVNDCSSITGILGSSSNNNSILSGFCSDCDSIFGIEVETTNMLSDKEMFEPRSSVHFNQNDEALTTPKLSSNQSQVEFSNGSNDLSEEFSLFDSQTKNSINFSNKDGIRPQLTVNMIIARKRLAARNSYQRLFGGKDHLMQLIV